MALDERVSIALPTKQKEAWERYVEEDSSISSKSELIRRSVESQYGDNAAGQLSGEGAGLTENDRDKLNTIANGVNSLREQVGSLDERVSVIENEARRSNELGQLKDSVYQLLPTLEPGTEEWESVDEWAAKAPDDTDMPTQPSLTEAARQSEGENIQVTSSGRVGEIAVAVGEGTMWIRAAAEGLLDDEKHVHRTSVDGQTYYWRER